MSNLFKKILIKIIPELKDVLTQNISFSQNINVSKNVEKHNLTKLYEPYTISNSKIGKGTYISYNSKISNTCIGKFCSIGPNFLCGWGIHPIDGISTSPYFYSTLKQNGETIARQDLIDERKDIIIGNDVFIGANVIVLDGVKIGDGVIIGAGCVVSKDVPDYGVVIGVPMKIIKYRFNETERVKMKKIEWWNFSDEKLMDVNKYFFDINRFIKKYQ